MRKRLLLNMTLLSLVILTANSTQLTANDTVPLIKEQPHNIYHIVKNKTLAETTLQLASRSGITFKLSADLKDDVISQKIAADDWKSALSQLLHGYNYTVISDKEIVKTVIITGRNGNGHNAVATPVAELNLIVVAPDFSKNLPGKYKNFSPGSVMNVNLPLKELADVAVGEDFTLDLPIGQYRVKHDDVIGHEDGSSTWIGYLNDEGKGYRVYLSQGEAGIIGNIYTPDGVYNIETENGHTVIVDLDKSGLQTAGYDNDDAEPAAAALMNAGLSTANDLPTDLKAAADSARAKADALAAEAKALYSKYQQALGAVKTAQNQVDYAQALVVNAQTDVVTIQSWLKQWPSFTFLNSYLQNAAIALNNANSSLASALAVHSSAKKNAETALAAYNKKQSEAQTAETNAKTAAAAYSAQLAGSSIKTSPTTSPTVDLMVLYTTVKQTAAYAKQRIGYLVDVSNQAYKDSGINMTLRLVHARPTTYVENNANTQALSDLASDSGAFAGTAALRNQYGADLVALFRPLYAQTAGSCGTAYVGFANGGNGSANSGFGAIDDGYSKDALSNYYCGPNTFTHEIGHNLGSVHDREYSNVEGKFSYSYAWGISGKFGTIMSYYGPSVMLFSTPALTTQCAGTPCGFPEGNAKSSDQTRTVNYTVPIVSNYKPTTTGAPVIQ
jgi:hypothetical protein